MTTPITRWAQRHPVPFWAATSAALGSVAGATLAGILTGEQVFEKGIAALITALVVGNSVYAAERLKEERQNKKRRKGRKQ